MSIGDGWVTFRPGEDIAAQAATLHQHAVEHGWFLHSRGKRTDYLMYGFDWDQLIDLLSQPPEVCDLQVHDPQDPTRGELCELLKDQLVTVPGGGHATSEDYLVATCPDLHRVAKVEPHRRWKCRRSGHWTGGAWHLPPGLVTGPVDDGELEQRRLLYHPRNLTGRGPADGQGGPPGLLEGL